MARTSVAVNPAFEAVQLPAKDVLLNTPRAVPAYTILGINEFLIRENTVSFASEGPARAQFTPPSVLLYTPFNVPA